MTRQTQAGKQATFGVYMSYPPENEVHLFSHQEFQSAEEAEQWWLAHGNAKLRLQTREGELYAFGSEGRNVRYSVRELSEADSRQIEVVSKMRTEAKEMYLVSKFFPPRCPRCEHPFHSSDDFGLWFNKGKSFIDALKNQKELFPELFPKTSGNKLIDEILPGPGYDNKFAIDFIKCSHCDNVTMRIDYASAQVETLEDAEELIEMHGFTNWQKVTAMGNMARPYRRLAPLARAELQMLQNTVEEARRRASETDNSESRTDIFTTTLDPAISKIVNRYRQEQVMTQVQERLRKLFGPLWQNVSPDCRDVLMTAEIIKDELMSYSENESTLDSTAVVHMYSVALEKEILAKIFVVFRDSELASVLPDATDQNSINRSLDKLKAFVGRRSPLTLGDMAYCLRNVGCELRNEPRNGFAQFLRELFVDFDTACDIERFPSRIIKYTDEYRNRAAHVDRLSREEVLRARAYLLEEPIRLLIALEEAFNHQL